MEIKKKIDDLLRNQKDLLKQYEDIVSELNMNHAVNENIMLKKEIDAYKNSVKELEKKQVQLTEENMNLKISLKEQVVNEKIGILNTSRKKIHIYFEKELGKDINTLKELEDTSRERLNKIKKLAQKQLIEEKEDMIDQIKRIELEFEEKIAAQKEKIQKEKTSILEEIKREYEEVKNEGVSEEVLKRKQKHNDIEIKIGLNLINKAGIILLFFGIATAMKYTYSTWFNEYMKGIAGFLFGGGLLGAGEWFNRKDKNLFACGLTGGGIGILYLAVFSCYFILNILNMQISILISILITVVSLVLSRRYKSMTVCGISLVGGYLPFFSYMGFEELSGNSIYIAMGYLFILNLLVLGISLERRWIYINYLSFILNTPCFIYLAFKSPKEIVGIGYGILTFMMYLAITLVYSIKEKIRLKNLDVILLGLNTVINCLIVYSLFEKAGYDSYRGILALIYACVYLGLGQFIYKTSAQEKNTQALFYITAMTFSVLMIPFQFGIEWTTLGWLIEGILVIYYAVKNNYKKMEIGGWIVFGLSVVAFILIDVGMHFTNEFILKYSFITVGHIYVFSLYAEKLSKSEMFKNTKIGKLLTYYKYIVIMNTWIYLIRVTSKYYTEYIDVYENDRFYFFVLIALITLLFSYCISRIKIIQDHVVDKISIFLYIFVDIIGFFMNFSKIESSGSSSYRAISIIILILFNIVILISIRDLILRVIKKKGISLEFYPMALAIYFLGVTTIFIVNQCNISNINLIISIFYIIMSFVYIIYGFKKKFMLLRRTGLAVSIVATAKLFILDLAFLGTAGRIIAYFCFGLVLIGISYIYHKIGNRIERIEKR